MKIIVKRLTFLILTFAAVIACDDDDNLNIAEVGQVEALFSPENEASIDLRQPSNISFEWQQAKSEDNGFVIYDLIFDVENGDFSEPIYVTPSNDRGFQNRVTLTSAQLNQVAELAGIERGTTGKVKWSVWTSKGLDIKLADQSSILELIRPNNFPRPDALYITGSATEGGTNLDSALQFKSTGATTFEIYTQLSPGTYKLVTSLDGSGLEYSIGTDSLEEGGENTFQGDAAVQRIRVDFNDNSVSVATIDAVELWLSAANDVIFSFDYAGNGTWEVLNEFIEFVDIGFVDDRYKFRFTVTTDGNTEEEWYGSTNFDNAPPDDNTPSDYFYMVPVGNSQFDETFKFRSELNMTNADIEIIFNNSVPEYTHTVTTATEPDSFPAPNELFITGSATEGGTDLNSALQFKSTGANSFEIYTQLSPGNYKLVTSLDGSGPEYSIGTNGLQENGETMYEGDTSVQRIQVSFDSKSVSIATINVVELWLSAANDVLFSFDYAGNGRWEALNRPIQFVDIGFLDDRYKFRFTVTTDGNTEEEWYGSTNFDNAPPDDNTPDSYFYVVSVGNSQFDETFKFRSEVNMSNVDIEIIFNNSMEEYIHTVAIQ